MPGTAIWRLALYLIYTHVVRGQTTNAVCENNATTGFLFNEAKESPCQTWSKLQSLCIPNSAFVNVPALADGTFGYNPPGTAGTACQCNIAAYNLMAACSWCQVGGDSTWSSQETYSAGCTTFVQNGLGFSQDSVDLPPFVWRTWDAGQFDPPLAAAAAPSFATTSLAPGTTTLSRSFPAVQSTAAPSLSESESASSSANSNSTTGVAGATDSPSPDHGHENQDSETPWAIILGSIGGAVAATIIIAMLVFFYFLRRKRRRAEGQQELSSDTTDGPPTGTGKRFDPSYHTSTDWKHKHRSFLEVLANPTKEERATGESFFSPRTPPRSFALAHQQSQRQRKDSNDSIESLRYTTTSERLERGRTTSFGSGSEVSFGLGVGTPKVGVKYLKAKDVTNISVVSPMTARTDMTSTHRGPGGLLEAVNAMKREEDDPLETPSTGMTRHIEGDSYPFPPSPISKPLPRPPALKSRLSTKIPDSRFSSVVALPQPPVTPAYDFTLPPEEYRRVQTRRYSGPKEDPRGSSALPSLYEPLPGATRYSLSQRTEYSKRNSKRGSRGAMSDDGESLIFSASTDSRYPSFIPDAQTVQRVKGMFGLSNIQFPLPPSIPRVRRKSGGSASASGDEQMSPHEWGKAKSKAKLTQEVMNIGKKDPIAERGNENGVRKGSF